jgi:hypothetical protein
VFNFVPANFYQIYVLFDYSIRFMSICGSVKMHSGWLAVNFDLQPLGLESDRKEGGIMGTKDLKFKSLHFHNINNL